MSDRGEKIVSLAHELLQNGQLCRAQASNVRKQAKEKSLALKAACMAALLTATASSSVGHFIHEAGRPINRYERFEIEALVFYAARESRTPEQALRAEIQKALHLSSLHDITAMDYRRVRDYLWTRLDD